MVQTLSVSLTDLAGSQVHSDGLNEERFLRKGRLTEWLAGLRKQTKDVEAPENSNSRKKLYLLKAKKQGDEPKRARALNEIIW